MNLSAEEGSARVLFIEARPHNSGVADDDIANFPLGLAADDRTGVGRIDGSPSTSGLRFKIKVKLCGPDSVCWMRGWKARGHVHDFTSLYPKPHASACSTRSRHLSFAIACVSFS
ncbi:Uncharacterized protein HZ326_19423 [Fusarium oxysporum f. sp. albedinis]|nr:Uncharacterized protein HZ326_19423 [Fusarium oxysporum f. sp. albedinis]